MATESTVVDRGLCYERRGGAALITFDRPHALNAIDPPMKHALVDAVDRFEADDELRVLVVTGSDCGAFCVGSDLKARAAAFDAGSEADAPPYADTIARCRKPVVAAIDGYCVGGGLELALACDIRIATAASSFGLPEVRIGTLGGYGIESLARAIPLGDAMLIHLTGARIDAERAHQIGLVQSLLADRAALFRRVDEIVDDFDRCAPRATRVIKHLVTTGLDLPFAAAAERSKPYKEDINHGDEAAEGARAFREKRAPSWDLSTRLDR